MRTLINGMDLSFIGGRFMVKHYHTNRYDRETTVVLKADKVSDYIVKASLTPFCRIVVYHWRKHGTRNRTTNIWRKPRWVKITEVVS